MLKNRDKKRPLRDTEFELLKIAHKHLLYRTDLNQAARKQQRWSINNKQSKENNHARIWIALLREGK
jgi:hypothetical protein